MEYVISILWVCMESISFFLLHDAFLPQRKYARNWKWLIVPASVLIGVMSCAGIDKITILILPFVLNYLIYTCLFEGSILWHILLLVLTAIMTGVIDTGFLYGSSYILKISIESLIWRKLQYVTVVSTGKLLTVFLAWFVRYVKKRSSFQQVQRNWLILILIFPAVSLAMLFVVFLGYQENNDLSVLAIIFSISLGIANIAIIYLIQKIEMQTRNEHETILLSKQMEIQTSSIVALEKSYRSQRQATHEFHRHLQIIRDLLAVNKVEKVCDYLDELDSNHTTRVLRVNSRHPIIDAVLNQKCQAAEEQEIDIQIQVNTLQNVNVPDSALVVLLSNILDNAIEACAKIETTRCIQCSIIYTDCLFISIRNTSEPVVIRGTSIETCKVPKEAHGFGIANAVRILDELCAEYTFNYEDGYFQFVAEIPRYRK